jgi:predicted acylesterase/phospholipase RssA
MEQTLGLERVTLRELPVRLCVAATRAFPRDRVVFANRLTASAAKAVLASTAMPAYPPCRASDTYHANVSRRRNPPLKAVVNRGDRVVLAVVLDPEIRRSEGTPGRILRQIGLRWVQRRELTATRAEGGALALSSPVVHSYAQWAPEMLDRIEEEGYKATQRSLPALDGTLGWLRNEEPSTPEPQGGTGGS